MMECDRHAGLAEETYPCRFCHGVPVSDAFMSCENLLKALYLGVGAGLWLAQLIPHFIQLFDTDQFLLSVIYMEIAAENLS